MASLPANQRVRSKKPKVRTGCLTCKIRRVKCDENKPGCLKCQKFGDACGYADLSRYQHIRSESRNFQISATGDTHLLPKRVVRPILPRISLQKDPSAAVPGDIVKRRYFDLFREGLVPVMCGHFDSIFWSCTIPQVCHQDPTIRNGVVALAALYKSSSSSSRNHQDHMVHRTFALAQLGKAVHNLRGNFAKGSQNTKLSVMASLIFGLFECLYGNWETAMYQFISARKFYAHSGPMSDEIAEALDRLQVVLVWFSVLNPIKDYEVGIDEMDDEMLEPLPEQLQYIRHVFGWIMKAAIFTLRKLRPTILLTRSAISAPASYFFELREERNSDFELWHTVYAKCKEASLPFSVGSLLRTVPTRQSLASLAFDIQTEIFDLMVAECMEREEIAMDKFLPRFQYIVATSRHCHHAKWEHLLYDAPMLQWGLGLTLCLYFTATRCREDVVRREAIAIQRQWSTRNVPWNSVPTARVAEWVADLEDEARDLNGFVPDLGRVKTHTLKWIVVGNDIQVSAEQGLNLHRTVLLWQ